MDDLEKWLESVGCGRHAASFRRNGITLDLLETLTEEDLRELGLNLGDRKRFVRGLSRLADTGELHIAGETSNLHNARIPTAERRRLTVMFIDLVGSTAISSQLDPEEWSDALQNCQDIMAGAVLRFSGHVAQFQGDGAVCLFGWPKALEDAAERSVEAALTVIENMRRVSVRDETINCRIGIATGLVVIGDSGGRAMSQDNTAIGETVNFAARLQTFAAHNQIVISESTRRLLGSAYLLQSLGERSFKGIPGTRAVYAIAGRNPAHERFAAQDGQVGIVERDAELSLLMHCWATAKQGQGQVVILIGEAGIGKSRVSHALLSHVLTEESAHISLQCSPFLRDTALSPVTNYLNRVAGIRSEDPAEDRLSKLRPVLELARLDEDDIEAIETLLDVRSGITDRLAAMSPSARRTAILSALAKYLTAAAARQPLLIRLEDAHWIDPTTLDLMDMIIDRIEHARILLLITTRPEGQPKLPSRSFVTNITLNRLGRKGVLEIVSRMGGQDLPEAIVEAIIERTDGVPLFVEELTKTIIERGDMSVPATLHDTLMARLDRLPGVKEIAQAASVFGREFLREPLAKVAMVPGRKLAEALEDLRRVELVFSRDAEEKSYSFKHALVRDAAYESLLNRRREEIHGRIFDVLKAEPHTAPSVLAYHAAAANRIDEAVEYGRRAAEEALSRPAYAEAITLLEKTLRLIAVQPSDAPWSDTRKHLLVLLRQAQIANLGYAAEATMNTSAEMERIARETDDHQLLIEALYGRWAGHYVPGRLLQALEVAEQVCAVSEAVEDTLEKALGYRLQASALIMMGQTSRAAESLAKFDRHYDPITHASMASRFGQEAGIARDCYELGLMTLVGRFDSAIRMAQRVVQNLERINHPHTTGYALGHIACFLTAAEIEPLGTEISLRCIETSERDGMPLWVALGEASLAVSNTYRGEAAAAVPELRRGLDALSKVNFNVFRTLFLPSYVIGLAESGDLMGAAVELAEARELIEQNGAAFFEAEIYRAEGRLALMQNHLIPAEASYEHALNRAQQLGHLTWELRAALDLFRLFRATGRSSAGRDLLSSVLSKFEEGHSLPLLRRAAEALG